MLVSAQVLWGRGPISLFGVTVIYRAIDFHSLTQEDQGALGEATASFIAAYFRDTFSFPDARTTLLWVGPGSFEQGCDGDLGSGSLDAPEVATSLDSMTGILNEDLGACLSGDDSANDSADEAKHVGIGRRIRQRFGTLDAIWTPLSPGGRDFHQDDDPSAPPLPLHARPRPLPAVPATLRSRNIPVGILARYIVVH